MCLAIYGVAKHLQRKKVGLDGFPDSFSVRLSAVEVEVKLGERKIEGLKLEVVRSYTGDSSFPSPALARIVTSLETRVE
ncbi:hypothetical protein F2Q70_00000495 [Brassica cretica]|uniref:Uncharacterized protein n=1 Tax=Brassica cretica TaxID=69181 RepID=A0A8S9IKN7_BRACR|nr:hypothetical protein F2Q70_00000495 [Brassica cretica]